MKEKKLGRVFMVGDKVRLTKAGEECGIFATEFREGDNAEIMELNKFDGSIYRVMVTSGEAKGYRQTCGIGAITKTWFEHVNDKKTNKKKEKKRKYFRMGDFVALKDDVVPSKALGFGVMPLDAIGIVCGNGGAVSVEVRYGGGLSDYDRVRPEALRLATKEERKSLRKHKIAKITYDSPCDNASERITEKETEIPPEYNVKIGDIVEVTQYYGGYPVGTIGQVDTIDEDIEGYHNRVMVKSFDGESSPDMNVKLVYRKPEISSK